MDDILAIEIIRTAQASHRIAWTPALTDAPLTVFGGQTPDTIDYATPLARGVRHPIEIPGLAVPSFFALQAPDRPIWIAGARQLALDGAVNLRDVGGYATDTGRRVRWGTLYRSGHLSQLAATAREEVAALDIRTVCDFRLADERATENATLPNNPRLETLAIPPGRNDQHFFHRLFESTDDPTRVVEEMHHLLRAFVIDLAPHYRKMFEVLLETRGPGAVLLNCSAGKERTGVGVALLLLALGVPRATVKHDFLLSGRYFPAESEMPRVLQKYAVPGKDPAVMRQLVAPLLRMQDSYPDTVLEAIDTIVKIDGGGLPGFFQSHYGLGTAELAQLRDTFTT